MVVAAYVLFVGALVVLSVIDARERRLPRRVIVPVAGMSIVLFGAAAVRDRDPSALARAILCAAAAGGAFSALHVVSPRGLGFGDVRLACLIGLDLGWLGPDVALLGLGLGIASAAAFGAVVLVIGARSRSDAIPLGPFLAIGALVAMTTDAGALRW